MEFCVKLLSLPLWERGLKSFNTHKNPTSHQSLPLWERGLKLLSGWARDGLTDVAPLVGAWIEIGLKTGCPTSGKTVAPLVGAWIEIITL